MAERRLHYMAIIGEKKKKKFLFLILYLISKYLIFEKILACNGCFVLLTKTKKGSGACFWCILHEFSKTDQAIHPKFFLGFQINEKTCQTFGNQPHVISRPAFLKRRKLKFKIFEQKKEIVQESNGRLYQINTNSFF